MTRPPSKRGGRRPNQTGRPYEGGRKHVTRSVAMLPEDWERLDKLRGELSRGRWIASTAEAVQLLRDLRADKSLHLDWSDDQYRPETLGAIEAFLGGVDYGLTRD